MKGNWNPLPYTKVSGELFSIREELLGKPNRRKIKELDCEVHCLKWETFSATFRVIDESTIVINTWTGKSEEEIHDEAIEISEARKIYKRLLNAGMIPF